MITPHGLQHPTLDLSLTISRVLTLLLSLTGRRLATPRSPHPTHDHRLPQLKITTLPTAQGALTHHHVSRPTTPPQCSRAATRTGKTLGAGSYSVVKECVHIDTGRYYAAKVINKRLMAGREHMVRNEIAVLKRVSMGHQNILTLVDYFETMNNRE